MFNPISWGGDERPIDRFHVEITEFFPVSGITSMLEFFTKIPYVAGVPTGKPRPVTGARQVQVGECLTGTHKKSDANTGIGF